MAENTGLTNRMVELAACKEHPLNYQKHGAQQIKDLARSLKKFGQVRSIVVQDDGTSSAGVAGGFVLVAGHGLAAAARSLGWTELRADVIPADWPAAKVLAYLAADNELGRQADPDEQQLAALVAQVKAEDAELAALAAGSESRLAELLAAVAEQPGHDKDPGPLTDQATELSEKWNTQVGQRWQLGPHRLAIGDASDGQIVREIIEKGNLPRLIVTDPPYAVDYIAKARDMNRRGYVHSRATLGAAIYNDSLSDEECSKIWAAVFRTALDVAMVQNAAWYVWHAPGRATLALLETMKSLGFLHHQTIIWVKNNFVIGRADYQWKHEPCWYGWQEGHRPPYLGEKNQTTVWEIARDTNKPLHPTQKPVECYIIPIKNHLRDGEALYDPFSGSGTAFVAAESTGMVCYGCELSHLHAATILERYFVMTGKTPALLDAGPAGAA